MKNSLSIGLWRYMLQVPSFLWEKQLVKSMEKFEKNNVFITAQHRAVHHFVVRELPLASGPLTPEEISTRLEMSLDRVRSILDELEERMTFLFRNQKGEIIWAYPVTKEKTPHRITFDTGERIYAA